MRKRVTTAFLVPPADQPGSKPSVLLWWMALPAKRTSADSLVPRADRAGAGEIVVEEAEARAALEGHQHPVGIGEHVVLDDPVRVAVGVEGADLGRVAGVLHGETPDRDVARPAHEPDTGGSSPRRSGPGGCRRSRSSRSRPRTGRWPGPRPPAGAARRRGRPDAAMRTGSCPAGSSRRARAAPGPTQWIQRAAALGPAGGPDVAAADLGAAAAVEGERLGDRDRLPVDAGRHDDDGAGRGRVDQGLDRGRAGAGVRAGVGVRVAVAVAPGRRRAGWRVAVRRRRCSGWRLPSRSRWRCRGRLPGRDGSAGTTCLGVPGEAQLRRIVAVPTPS